MNMQSPVSDALDRPVLLEPHDSQNTNWIGISSIGPILINNEPPPYSATEITMQFSKQFSAESLTLSSSEDITIVAAATWEFAIPEQPLALSPGTWDWVMKVKDTRNVIMKLYAGQLIVRP